MAYNLTQIRVFRAPTERVYRALLDPAALAKWSAPDGFTVVVHELQATIGGRFRISFVNFSNGQTHTFGGEYRDLSDNYRISVTERFEDDALPGEMTTTYTLNAVSVGTELKIEQSGLPDMIPAEACRMGWQQSLELLARLVEAEIPAE